MAPLEESRGARWIIEILRSPPRPVQGVAGAARSRSANGGADGPKTVKVRPRDLTIQFSGALQGQPPAGGSCASHRHGVILGELRST
jgi:hypothetical protein